MILQLVDFLVKDFVYKQNPDHSYIFKNDDFVPENRNDIIDTILSVLKDIYTGIIKINNVNPSRIECNTCLLDQALTRYSRDVFGELRLNAKIDHLGQTGRLTKSQQERLSEFSDYGLKIDSCRPYFHRQLANLLYWLSVLKPFSVFPDDNSVIKPLGVAFEFHNEYISYLFALVMLKNFNKTLNVHKHKELFYDFLYDLHFRKLSRSSLEFFLNAYIRAVN